MRKRIVIGLLAIIVGGGIAALVFRPWEDTIEYHKRVYFASPKGGTWFDHLADAWDRVWGRAVPPAIRSWHHREITRHERARSALLKLGYLEERTFFFSNEPPAISNFWSIYWSNFHTDTSQLHGNFQSWETNSFTVVAPRKEMPKWEEAVRKADVPQNGK